MKTLRILGSLFITLSISIAAEAEPVGYMKNSRGVLTPYGSAQQFYDRYKTNINTGNILNLIVLDYLKEQRTALDKPHAKLAKAPFLGQGSRLSTFLQNTPEAERANMNLSFVLQAPAESTCGSFLKGIFRFYSIGYIQNATNQAEGVKEIIKSARNGDHIALKFLRRLPPSPEVDGPLLKVLRNPKQFISSYIEGHQYKALSKAEFQTLLEGLMSIGGAQTYEPLQKFYSQLTVTLQKELFSRKKLNQFPFREATIGTASITIGVLSGYYLATIEEASISPATIMPIIALTTQVPIFLFTLGRVVQICRSKKGTIPPSLKKKEIESESDFIALYLTLRHQARIVRDHAPLTVSTLIRNIRNTLDARLDGQTKNIVHLLSDI